MLLYSDRGRKILGWDMTTDEPTWAEWPVLIVILLMFLVSHVLVFLLVQTDLRYDCKYSQFINVTQQSLFDGK